jgi:hypothetical protein
MAIANELIAREAGSPTQPVSTATEAEAVSEPEVTA